LINIRKLERAMETRRNETQSSQSNLYTSELERQIADTEAKRKAEETNRMTEREKKIQAFKDSQNALLANRLSEIDKSALDTRNATV
jgi:hypothetical protein